MGLPDGNLIEHHQSVSVCPRSRTPSTIHASHEAHEESSKSYEMRRTGYNAAFFYHNPLIDTVYFGGLNYCAWALQKSIVVVAV